MVIVKFKIIIFAGLIGILVLLGVVSRHKSHSAPILKSELHVAPKQSNPTQTYHDPEAIEFEVAGKELKSVTPFEIERFVNQHQKEYISFKKLWKAFGIEDEEWRIYAHCQVVNFKVSLDHKYGAELLQRIDDKSSWSMGGTRFLVWEQYGKTWKFVEFLDYVEQRYEEPRHRVIQSGKRNFLIINSLGIHGAGVGSTNEEWYELQSSGMKIVLGYCSRCYEMSVTEKHSTSKISSVRLKNGNVNIRINFSTEFKQHREDGEVIQRWRTRKHATYIWSEKINRFILKTSKSNITQKQIDAVCDL